MMERAARSSGDVTAQRESEMGAAAAAVLIKERHIVDAFVRAGAVSAERARLPEDVGAHIGGIGWRRLRNRAVVREASPGEGLYYVDVEVWEATRRRQRRMLFVVFIVVVAALVGVLLRR
jgi:hypothetical protein